MGKYVMSICNLYHPLILCCCTVLVPQICTLLTQQLQQQTVTNHSTVTLSEEWRLHPPLIAPPTLKSGMPGQNNLVISRPKFVWNAYNIQMSSQTRSTGHHHGGSTNYPVPVLRLLDYSLEPVVDLFDLFLHAWRGWGTGYLGKVLLCLR